MAGKIQRDPRRIKFIRERAFTSASARFVGELQVDSEEFLRLLVRSLSEDSIRSWRSPLRVTISFMPDNVIRPSEVALEQMRFWVK